MRLTVADAQQLSSHANVIADATQTPVDHVIDTKIASGDQRIDRSAVITQHAARRSHDETPNVAESRDQCVSESDTEILVTGVFSRRTQNAEGKYGDRLLVFTQLPGNGRQRSQTVIQLAQQIVEKRVTVKRIELGIDARPKHFCIARLVSSLEEIERFFRTIELARDECEMVRRNVTTLGQQVHVVQYGLRLLEIAGGGIRTAESSERVRSFAHQLNAPLSRLNGLSMTAQPAQHETRAVERHQIPRFVFQARGGKTISLVKTARVIRTPDHRKARYDGEWIEIATSVRLSERLAKPSLHRELQRIPNTRGRVVRIELDRAYEMMLRTAPGEVAAKDRLPERNVSFREIRIDIDRR